MRMRKSAKSSLFGYFVVTKSYIGRSALEITHARVLWHTLCKRGAGYDCREITTRRFLGAMVGLFFSGLKKIMIKRGPVTFFDKFLAIGFAVLFLVTASIAGLASDSELPEISVSTVVIPGLSSELNNVIDLSGKLLVAPFAPWGEAARELGEDFDPSTLNNHYVYLIDSKNPSVAPLVADLGCYWPTRVCFDQSSGTLFARGTVYVPFGNGKLQPAEVVSYLRLSSKLEFDPRPVVVPIYAVSGDPTQINVPRTEESWASSAPHDFVIGRDGKFLIFTNGASVFAYNTEEGYVHRQNLVPDADYSLNNTISRIDIDSESNTLAVTVNERFKKRGDWRHFSDVYFFRLSERGGLELLKKVDRTEFPDGTAVTDGSNVEIVSDSESGEPKEAFLAADDGSLLKVDLTGESREGEASRLASFVELKAPEGETRGPVTVEHDSSSQWIGISRPGRVLQIRRPAWNRPGRRGRASRGFSFEHLTESPVLALAKRGETGDVVATNVLADFGESETSISNLVFDNESRALFTTGSGRLLSIGETPGELVVEGDLGTGVDALSYKGDDSMIIGVRSFDSDQSSGAITAEGALVIAQFPTEETTGDGSNSGSVLSAFVSPGVERLFAVIRRPDAFLRFLG